MICDLAETYGILNYKELSPSLVATLVVGLKDGSRLKMKLNSLRFDNITILLAGIIDRLSSLVWLNSIDGQKGINKPKSILSAMIGEDNNDVMSFNSVEEFESERKRIIERWWSKND